MNDTVLLAIASVLAVGGSVVVFARDLAHDDRSRVRVIVEAALPLLGVAALTWWSWASL
jgi:hypothetical protein